MKAKDPKNSVQDEQISEKSDKITEESTISKKVDEINSAEKDDSSKLDEIHSDTQDSEKTSKETKEETKSDVVKKALDDSDDKAEITEAPEVTADEEPVAADKKEVSPPKAAADDEPVVADKKEVSPPKEEESISSDNKKEVSASENKKPIAQKKEKINFSLLSKPDMVKVLEELVSGQDVNKIGHDVDDIKIQFYKKHKGEVEEKRKKFIADGGIETDFSPGIDENELVLKKLLKKYRDQKFQMDQVRESEKGDNLKRKFEIIERIKALVHNDESINKTFQEFRDLQRDWFDIGLVPQKDLKSLWETYHYHVEKFYDYIKINNELRDLDLKKNLEAKIVLCEFAEALNLETNIVTAFQTLQKYHDQWREIGPVPKEQRTEIWDRFKLATAGINKKHQQHYQELKDQQIKNLESKTLLCEKAEEVLKEISDDHPTWVKKTREILELQKVWKTIGFAPKKDNNKIYSRFRTVCDTFFEGKRGFYSKSMDSQKENLQKKMELCEIAEGLMNSDDWRNTSDGLIKLQKKWKTIGPVPRKQSDEVWRRFRAACDHFFNNRAKYFSNIDATYESNLIEKQDLIKKIESLKPGEDQKENLSTLNDLQRKWMDIGFVPIKQKEDILEKYREAINKQLDGLDLGEHKKNMLKFKNKLENINQRPQSDMKLRFEREKMMSRLQQLKSDISIWENNIGFFASTAKANSMVSEFQKKTESAHEKMKLLEDKISTIDDIAPDL